MITHTVLFRFSADDATAATEVAEAKRLLELMPPLIHELRSLWVGVDGRRLVDGTRIPPADDDVLLEALPESSYDLALVTTHESWDELDGYLAHPEHIRLTAFIRERATERAVVDAAD